MGSEVIWVGIDVGRYFHAWCAIDADGRVVWERKRVPNTTWTMQHALQQLHRVTAGRSLCFATEEPAGNAAALVRLLTGAGERVYLAQALRVHRFHLALGQPHKSDPYDARVIAQFARQNAGQLPPVRTGTPQVQALRVLSRRTEAVSKDLRRCLNRLRGVLAEYAPEWLTCGLFKCWSTEAALHTLQRYGRVSKLQRTPLGRLTKALSQWTRGHWGEAQARALQEVFKHVALPPQLEDAYVQTIESLVSQLRSLMAEKQRLLRLMASAGGDCPQLEALQREFGYGLETASVIISEIGEIGDFPSEAAFATYCGVTPITRSSGISTGSSRLSRFTNRRLLRALIQSAYSAAHHHPESKAYYQKKLPDDTSPRARTNALIALARHRVRRLYRLLRQTSASLDTAA